MIYSDFSILDPGEPVLGDYDQVDEGADAIWPSAGSGSSFGVGGGDEETTRVVTCSPNFTALLATAGVGGEKEGMGVSLWDMGTEDGEG